MKPIFKSILTIFFLVNFCIIAQDTTESLAFRNKHPKQKAPYFYRPELAYQIWQKFKLTQEANAGDVLAQHELGLRYLLGEGIPADTNQAVYWIKKAAEKNLTSAKYNYAIMLINGIGVSWDPFSAFKYFKSAAEDGMVQAQYIVGVLYTDNLTVARDWNIAFYWIKKSADGDYQPAKDILAQLEPKISKEAVDSLFIKEKSRNDSKPVSNPEENLTSSMGLVFIDFDALTDSVIEITDSMLIADLEITGVDSLIEELDADSVSLLEEFANASNLDIIIKLAENGCPEAQTILGRLYEKGIYFRKDLIEASAYYYRALRNDSPKAANLLWKLAQSADFLNLVQKETENENPVAKFVWYGLTALGFDNRIVIADALKLLDESAEKLYLPAMMEAGLNYYTGRYRPADPGNGISFWETAGKLGSKEAGIRLAASRLFDSLIETERQKDFKLVKAAANEGSLFAMLSVALCYKNGIGTIKSLPESVHYLKLAAQRGSQFAYEELKRLFDSLRPADDEFILKN